MLCILGTGRETESTQGDEGGKGAQRGLDPLLANVVCVVQHTYGYMSRVSMLCV